MSRIDFHTHLAPRLADVPGAASVHRDDRGRLVVDGHPVGPPALYEPARLETWMDERGLDEAVVSPPPPFFRQRLDPAATAAWVRALNDGVLAAVDGRPRLLPLGYLPLEHPDVALAELERLTGDDRWAGVCGSAGGRSRSLADGALDPLWTALDGRLVFLHPGMSPDPRLEDLYLHNLLGNPVETAIAAAELVLGDVLARHPGVRVMLVHCGGCVPDLVPRWQRGVDTERPGLRSLTEPPVEAVRRLWVDCLVHDSGAVDRAVEVFGGARMVLGSDWPFPMGTDDPAALVAHRGAAFADACATANAAAALGRR